MNRKRLLVGIAIAAVGVVMARANQLVLGPDSPYALIAYILGVFIGLGGLAVVGSSLTRNQVRVIHCPECFAENPAAAELCLVCSKPHRPSACSGDTSEDIYY